MPDDMHERDVLEWSVVQADLLHRLRLGERPNDLDWDNLIDEIRDVGRSELRATTSLLARALEHLLKMAAWPGADPERHWAAEALVMLQEAHRAYSPSMAQLIDIPSVYAAALSTVSVLRIAGRAPGPVVPSCPFTLEELLSPAFDHGRAITQLEPFRTDYDLLGGGIGAAVLGAGGMLHPRGNSGERIDIRPPSTVSSGGRIRTALPSRVRALQRVARRPARPTSPPRSASAPT